MTSDDAGRRWAWAEIDLDAIVHNVEILRRIVSPSALWAVVKADGYGHGAAAVARAARAGGAAGLCVALVREGVELRAAGVDGPILVLSQQPPEELGELLEAELTATVYSADGIDALASVATARGVRAGVHLKLDTGMHRVGAHVDDAVAFVQRIVGRPSLSLEGIFTHLAVADEPDDPFTDGQLAAFDVALRAVGVGPGILIHAANSAGALAHPSARRSAVRTGIAIYGLQPGPGVAGLTTELRPAMSLHARVSFVKRVEAGEAISYGLRHRFDDATFVATIPLGYADGVPRRLSGAGGEVLIGGRRCPIVGVVTMDQFMVDCGADPALVPNVGDEVVLIGRQGDDAIDAADWAARLGTIDYEIACGISARVPRRYVGSPSPRSVTSAP